MKKSDLPFSAIHLFWKIKWNLIYSFRLISLFLQGESIKSKVKCPVCGNEFAFFLKIDLTQTLCPSCLSHSRHRAFWFYLKEKENILNKKLKVLHISPEYGLYYKIKKLKNIDYYACDKFSKGYYYPKEVMECDIEKLCFSTNYFDMVICNHVYEHVKNDKNASEEIFRVLKRGKKALITVPIDEKMSTFEGKNNMTSKQREKIFGQKDHIRIYGKDFKNRLKNSNFIVRTEEYRPDERTIKLYDLFIDKIFICIKP